MTTTTTTTENQAVELIESLLMDDMPTSEIREMVYNTYQITADLFTKLFTKAFHNITK